MRIAVSGSHRVGKTTLAEALADALPSHRLVPEPYVLLEEEGYEFAEMPSLEDFEAQLERSIASVAESAADTIFDRCPLDLLGYLTTHQDAAGFRIEEWLLRVRKTVATIDLIVFVPIEKRDCIVVSRAELEYRAHVDDALRDIIVADRFGLEPEVVEVSGAPAARLSSLKASLPGFGMPTRH